MGQAANRSHGNRMQSPLLGIAASLLFIIVIVAVLVKFGAHEQVLRLLAWFETQGTWALLLFTLVMAAVVVLVLPGVFFTTGAGFVFGLVEGSFCVIVGTTLGATLAFLIARYLFGQRARRFIMSHSKLQLVSEELSANGWKIVLLTRLIPFFPGKISNYFFGLTEVPLPGYVGGSLLGFIPFSIHNVYLGSIAADLSTLGQRNLERSPLEWSLYGAGFVVTIFAVVYLNHLARRALARYQKQDNTKGDSR